MTMVVRFHSSVPSDSGKSVGMVYAETSRFPIITELKEEEFGIRCGSPSCECRDKGSVEWIGDRSHQRVLGLSRVQSRMLHNDGHIRFNQARKVRIARNRCR